MTDTPLAARRQALIDRCAEQRINLVLDLRALRGEDEGHPLASGALGLLAARLLAGLLANKRLAMGVASAVAGLALVRPRRLAHLVRLAASGMRLARSGMGLVARFRQ